MSTFKVFFNLALSFLLLVHPSVQQPKLVDFSVLDVSSKSLQRIEHLLAELLDIVSKAVPYHERHIQLLSKQIAENTGPEQENAPAQGSQPKPSIVVDVSRKSFLSRLHELENSFDNSNSMNQNSNNANVNTNTNVNTNANTNFNTNVRKRPLTSVYLNDDMI
ncbi:hypothetical protein KQX54_005175 [Cotesia glomerata]|uniref:Uncharacterized protein n=1 Tax=Cotesia glomerata TaxID=32391 RepID=A0AAV7I9J3_COTGL|nr:hypothetical protein KQX54_005175 [Cotesia glomerata]